MVEGRDWTGPAELDVALIQFFCVLFLDGYEAATGQMTIAALRHFLPEMGSSTQWPLPRAERALQGWRSLLPPRMRLPLPRAAAGCIAGLMISHGRAAMAVFILLCFVTYMRPGEALRLKGRCLVPPFHNAAGSTPHYGIICNDASDGTPGKTGSMDEAVELDLDPWIVPVIAALRSLVGPEDSLWAFRPAELRAEFYRCVAQAGLQKLAPHLYSMRHGGASHDLLLQRRSLAQVKERGHWHSDASLRRYGKSTRMHAIMGQLSPAVANFGDYVVENLAAVLQRYQTFRAIDIPDFGVAPSAP